MSKQIAAIVNPVSGRRDLTLAIRKIGRIVTEAGASFTMHRTAGPGDATNLASQCRQMADAVLVVGGDGTVCEVVNGLMPQEVPVLIYRSGTENLLARELNMPTAPGEVAQTLLKGRPIPYDVGVFNDRRFLVVAGIGFDAECVYRMTRRRTGHITHLDYFWPIWRTFWAHRFPNLRVELDGSPAYEGRGFVILGILPRYSVGMRILADAAYDDGWLDVCIFPCANRIRLIGHAARSLARRHTHRGDVIYRRARHVCVTSSERVHVETDGEHAGFLPAEFGVLTRAARFLVGTGWEGKKKENSLTDFDQP